MTAPCLAIAEARLALDYLVRAEQWAAGVDESIVDEIVLVHRRLLERIEALRPGPNQTTSPLTSALYVEVDSSIAHKI